MSIKLKPCPFCGYDDVMQDEGLYQSGKFFVIVCGQCMANVQGDNTVEAIKLWSTRPTDKLSKVRAEVEECNLMAAEAAKLVGGLGSTQSAYSNALDIIDRIAQE